MRQPVGWIGLACLAALGCSSTVTDTRASRDAAVDAPADAPADAVDFTHPPPALNPCDAARLVDLDRVGLATGRGLGVVFEHANAPEVQIGPTGGGPCARLYRPVVLRVRAPRAGLLFVSLPRQLAPTAIVRARRMERCDASGAAIACDAPTHYCVSESLCGELLGAVADGQVVDVAIGLETYHPRGLQVTPGRIAVSVTVLPTLPSGAVCDERQGLSLCAAGLVCNPRGVGTATARCGRPGAPGDRCDLIRCGAGLRCEGAHCVSPLAPGARCIPRSTTARCASPAECVHRGGGFVCALSGSEGARCDSSNADGVGSCDPGLACDATDSCSPPGNRTGVCDATRACAAGSRCVPGNPARCVPPGFAGGSCVREGERLTCAEGLVCARGSDAVCVPALAASAACEADNHGGPECGPGLVCSFNRCVVTGAAEQPCTQTGRQQDCAAPLTCNAYRCSLGPGEGERCTVRGACRPPLRCDAWVCRTPGGPGALCRDRAPRCDEGLGCSDDRCRPASAVGTPCSSDPSVCTEPLRCSFAFDGTHRCYAQGGTPCGRGCAAGTVCREGECVVDGRCERARVVDAQPCGDGRYCLPASDGTLACLPPGVPGGRCRADRLAPCDPGSICALGQCVPLLAEGAGCRLDLWQRGACGSGLFCAPPDGCTGKSGMCAWPSAPPGVVGRCRPVPAPGTVGGDCRRAPDGAARCDGDLTCDALTLRCAAASRTEACVPPTAVCPEGTACGPEPEVGLRCVAAGANGQPCRADAVRPCDDGLRCGPMGCAPVGREGDLCGVEHPLWCEPGFECRSTNTPPGLNRCARVGVEGTPCGGADAHTCERGFACRASVCIRALAEGVECAEGGLPCESGTGCARGAVTPRVCVPLLTLGAPCLDAAECGAGLTCGGRECVPLRYAGEACDPAALRDGCEEGFACEGGVCRAPGEGSACANGRCREGTRCVRDQCVRPHEPGEACSPTDARTTCRDDSACATDVCRVLGSRGALCRRGPDAPACDVGLRCDVVADRCVP